ncbi:hypothetical protein GH714_013580 [Hevea brasiliensis]|uniref:Uncharacterized protein n=1 Tax=Hevea brasiliensis TaxID=3981 RepID=A0A6A6KSQ9_HEVBR|nr:hypothetical protein GH714_013580 [Hevea brasiliensis]
MKNLRPIRVAKEDGEKEGQPLSPMARVFHEPNSNVYIVVIMGFKTPINPDVVKIKAQTFLKHLVSLVCRSMPMWDIHILKVKTSEAESTSILRVHHSIGDGTSLMSLLLSCTRKVSNPTELPTLPTLKKRNPNDSAGFWHLLLKLWMLVLLCWNTVVDVVIFLATILFLEDTKTPLKGASPVGSTARRFVHRTISLDDVKLVKNTLGATINDVMMAITQADCLAISIGSMAFEDMTRKDSEARWGNHIGYMGNFPTQTTLWFSNVAGPQEEISYFGHPVTFIAPTLYGQPNALMIHVVSYENKMKIILSADENIIPDPHQLCDDLQNSLSLSRMQ